MARTIWSLSTAHGICIQELTLDADGYHAFCHECGAHEALGRVYGNVTHEYLTWFNNHTH